MLEVTNLTDRTQTLGKNTTVGLVKEVDGIQQWQAQETAEKTPEQQVAEEYVQDHDEPPELMSSDDEYED